MSTPAFRIPEPNLPEHKLLQEAAPLPQLSQGLRERTLSHCERQVRYGRWADRLRILGAVLAASLMVGLVWNFRWTGQGDSSAAPDVVTRPSETSQRPWSSANSRSVAPAPADKQAPPNPSPKRQEMKDMQQINQLIEKLDGRNNSLCSFLPVWP